MTPASALHWELDGTPSREATKVSSSLVCPCFMQKASFVPQLLRKQSMWTLLRTACALVLCFVGRPSTLRMLTSMQIKGDAIALGASPPRLQYPPCPRPKSRCNLSAFARSAWPGSSPLVFTTAMLVPSEAASLSCARVFTSENCGTTAPCAWSHHPS